MDLNTHYANAAIKSHILSDEEMESIGFTNYNEPHWFFTRQIKFPNLSRYRNFEVTFNVTIPKDGSDIYIDVLDEDFCQPYDYQMMLSHNPKLESALIVQEQVEQWMDYLQEKGVLSGHIKGEYI